MKTRGKGTPGRGNSQSVQSPQGVHRKFRLVREGSCRWRSGGVSLCSRGDQMLQPRELGGWRWQPPLLTAPHSPQADMQRWEEQSQGAIYTVEYACR